MSRNEYGERPLYAGAVLRGQRVWYVDQSGQLYGMTYPKPWVGGENVAECFNESSIDGIPRGCSCPLCSYMVGSTTGPPSPKWRETEHEVGINCQCGFYGITDPHNEYLYIHDYTTNPMPRIEGLVEGYGKVVVGSKGFRAQKAKIVALVVNESRYTTAATRSWHDLTPWEKQERQDRCEGRNLPPVFLVPPNTEKPEPVPMAVPIMSVPHLTHDIEHHAPKGVYTAGEVLAKAERRGCLCLRGLAEEIVQKRRAHTYGGRSYLMDASTRSPHDWPYKVNVELLANRYGVTVYPSMALAQQEFPLIGGDQLAAPSSDNASTLEEVDEALKAIGPATYVDPDGPDSGAL